MLSVADKYFPTLRILLAETKNKSKLHHLSCQKQFDSTRQGFFNLVNLGEVLPLLSDQDETPNPHLASCCKGLTNLELLIFHLGTMADKPQPNVGEDVTEQLLGKSTHLVSGKALFKIISRIPSFAAGVVYQAGGDDNDHEDYVIAIFNSLNDIAPGRYTSEMLDFHRERLLKCLEPLNKFRH